MRQRVVEAARRLGYRPDFFASSMRRRTSRLVGLIRANPPEPASMRHALKGLEAELGADYRLLFLGCEWFEEQQEKAVDMLRDLNVEGLLLWDLPAWFPFRVLAGLRARGTPLAAISGPRCAGVPHFRSDVRGAFGDLTRHLLAAGRRRLVLLTKAHPPQQRDLYWRTYEREEGFRDGLQGCPEAKGWLCREGEESSKLGQEPKDPFAAGYVGMKAVMTGAPWRPDAVICTNDLWAAGALRAARELGLDVPREMALTGFDNLPLGAYLSPSLTTMEQALEDLISGAVGVLSKAIKGAGSADDGVFKLPCRLIARESAP